MKSYKNISEVPEDLIDVPLEELEKNIKKLPKISKKDIMIVRTRIRNRRNTQNYRQRKNDRIRILESLVDVLLQRIKNLEENKK